MNLKHRTMAALLSLTLLLGLTACHSSKSFTFQIDNGEQVKVTLNTTDGYDLTQEDGTFAVEEDGKTILYGRFLKPEGFALYQEEMSKQKNAKLVTLEPADSPTLCIYTFDGSAGPEVDYLMKLDGGETVVYLYTTKTAAEAEKLVELLTFEFE